MFSKNSGKKFVPVRTTARKLLAAQITPHGVQSGVSDAQLAKYEKRDDESNVARFTERLKVMRTQTD